jgi:hypothetical protein
MTHRSKAYATAEQKGSLSAVSATFDPASPGGGLLRQALT